VCGAGALRLPSALHDELYFDPRAEVFSWADRALELPGAAGHPELPGALATVSRAAINRGDFDHGRRLAQEAFAGADGEDLTTLRALYLLNNIALYQGRLDEAMLLADQRLRLAEALGQRYHRALAGVSRVLAHRYQGNVAAAVHAAADARSAAETSGNHTARAWALYASGEALLDSEPDEAARLLEQAIEAARRVERRLIEGVALVSLASLTGRHGDSGRALALFRETVAHWCRLGDYTHQLTTLRNLVDQFARARAEEAAATLHGAVTVGSTPSFGPEAERLAAAWSQVEERLGADAARAASERGRHMPLADMVDEALATLDALLR
jgi:tetratricopeptide (TPR) repeat protein